MRLAATVLFLSVQVARCQQGIDGYPSGDGGSQIQQVQIPYGSPYGAPATPYGKDDWSGNTGGFPGAYTVLSPNTGPEYLSGAVESHEAWQGKTPKQHEGHSYLDNPHLKMRMVNHPDQGQLHATAMPPTHRSHPTEKLWHTETNGNYGGLALGSMEYTLSQVSDSNMFQSMHLESCITAQPGYDLQSDVDYLNLHPRSYHYCNN